MPLFIWHILIHMCKGKKRNSNWLSITGVRKIHNHLSAAALQYHITITLKKDEKWKSRKKIIEFVFWAVPIDFRAELLNTIEIKIIIQTVFFRTKKRMRERERENHHASTTYVLALCEAYPQVLMIQLALSLSSPMTKLSIRKYPNYWEEKILNMSPK